MTRTAEECTFTCTQTVAGLGGTRRTEGVECQIRIGLISFTCKLDRCTGRVWNESIHLILLVPVQSNSVFAIKIYVKIGFEILNLLQIV